MLGGQITEYSYYAYGLKIATLCSKKLGDSYEGTLKNNYLYNDKEFFEDADLNWYDYGFRNYDPQIGRFMQLDPLTFNYPFLTSYQYASCDPINNIDVDGLEGITITGKVVGAGVSSVANGITEGLARVAIKIGSAVSATGGIIKIANLADNISKGTGVGNWLRMMKERASQRLGSARDWIKDTWNQAGENFDNRWEARADPLHQALDNPLSMLGGFWGIEANAASQALRFEGREAMLITGERIDLQITEEAIELKVTQKIGPLLTEAQPATKVSAVVEEAVASSPKYSKEPPGNLTKLKNGQGWRDKDGNIWKKDMKHKDHWDVSNEKTGNKIKEVDFNGNQLWPDGPKNKNK